MLSLNKNTFIFHCVTGFATLAFPILLGACATHENPGSPDNAELVHIAEQLHAKGDDGGAADFYNRALAKNPSDMGLHREFGEMLEAHGDYQGAADQYRAALNIAPPSQYRALPEFKPSDVELLRDYGRVLIRLGQPSFAQPVYAEALRLDPNDIKSLNGVGVCLDQLNNHVAAQHLYQEALADKPDDEATIANLGHSYVLSGSYNEAIALLEPHLNDKNATATLRQNLAEAYGMSGMDIDAARVSRYDLTAEQTKHNVALYRAKRKHLSAGSALYADLGVYPTADTAQAHVDAVKLQFPAETDGLAITVLPKVTATGGTPSFDIRVTGFEKAATLRNFCLKLKKQKTSCAAKMEM